MSPDPQKTSTEPGATVIATRNFGEIQVRADQIITFTPGLLGFVDYSHYILIEHGQESPFLWLQCVDNPELAFVVMDPTCIMPDYRPGPVEGLQKDLEVENTGDLKVLVILTIPPGKPQEMTANLMGPLVINLRNRRGKQLIIEKPPYSHKHQVLPQ